ncbi:MAG: hypothetical protein EXX96DRAFT_585443 [Benjaminiella poitrasii]|nr:MAG: hypothetical protein EXX96DRAFT_585443 [Benjaminiella poitrasii]
MEHVLMWDENKVTKWMASIGYSSYEKQFKEQGITGDVLVNLDHESLRDLSVLTVGQRMDLLKNIYQLKMQYRVPVNEWDYIPPSVLYETDWLGQNGMADYRKIEAAFQERDARIKRLTEDLQKVNNGLNLLKEEVSHLLKYNKHQQNEKPTKMPYHNLKQTFNDTEETKVTNITTNTNTTPNESNNGSIGSGGAIKVYGDKITNKVEQHEPESSKNVRLLLDDPTSKVIMSALKKYNVNSDWQQYALWIQHGAPDDLQERALGYDERPLRISQKLKEAKQNPVFVLKHVKDNKPFIPPNYTHPRPAPKPQLQLQQPKQQNNSNIATGKVGFEVVIPVMSSSASTPTTNSPTVSTKRGHPIVTTTPTPTATVYNNELGLDNAVVNAIFSINNSTQNP